MRRLSFDPRCLFRVPEIHPGHWLRIWGGGQRNAGENATDSDQLRNSAVAIDDLYAVAKPVIETIGRPNDVHFAPAGYSLLAKAVAESIAAQLPR